MVTMKFIFIGYTLCFVNMIIVIPISTADNLRRILPTMLKIREGQNMQLRLTKILDGEISCYVRSPALVNYNLKIENNSSRINYWTENGECGVRVSNVRKDDEGRWRLTSRNETRTLVDVAMVKVLDKLNLTEHEISIFGGLDYTLNLADNSKYCTVKHPRDDERIPITNDCKIDINRPTTADSGRWIAKVSVEGQIQEVLKTTYLNVFQEHVTAGYERTKDSKFLRIFCNLKYHNGSLDLCKFVKSDVNETSLQMSDGLHMGRYGYYGAGLSKGECGLSIESPREDDYGKWHCLISVDGESFFGSYVQVFKNDTDRSTVKFSAQISSVTPVVTTVGEQMTLECSANVPLSYCWFSGPDGTTLTPPPLFIVVRRSVISYRYIGEGLGNGKCGIQISAEAKHDGIWTCHMGPSSPGIELASAIVVRIAETPLAAKNENVTVEKIGTSVTLECRTVPKKMALEYCRFYSPDATGIHINEEITEERPLVIEDTYYWFSGISPSLGDCGLVIGQVSQKHIGKWTCAARLENDKTNDEAFDTIEVYLADEMIYDDVTTVGAGVGIVMGILVTLATIALTILFAVRKLRNNRQPPQQNEESSVNIDSNALELNSVNSSSSSNSINSQLSLTTWAETSMISRH